VADEKILVLKSNEIKWRSNNETMITEYSGQSESAI
jgi:hypothetical protein